MKQDQIRQFIHLSKYAKWIDNKRRREESLRESAQRYADFWLERGLIDKNQHLLMIDSIAGEQALPSMRALMTAGPALARDNVAGYNCAYTAVETVGSEHIELQHPKLKRNIVIDIANPICFDEIFYILLCGTGVGYSVERQYITTLPVVGEELPFNNNFNGVAESELSTIIDGVIHVADSKYGWASALRHLIFSIYNGHYNVTWDVSKVRKKGERLKTFGGRASGPEPLVRLLTGVKEIMLEAKGRKLTSIECHSIVCLIADVVVVGGVVTKH